MRLSLTKLTHALALTLLTFAAALAQSRPSEINVAQADASAAATASSTITANYSAFQVINADRTGIFWGQPDPKSGGWNSGNSERNTTSTFTIQLGRLYRLTEIVTVGLQTNFNNPVEPDDAMTTVYANKSFTVQGSNDCAAYSNIGSVSNNDKVVNRFPVSGGVLAKCVRIVFDNSQNASGYSRLIEVSVYAKQ